jgi:hypothetical protein
VTHQSNFTVFGGNPERKEPDVKRTSHRTFFGAIPLYLEFPELPSIAVDSGGDMIRKTS